MDIRGNIQKLVLGAIAVLPLFGGSSGFSHAQAASTKKPNIVVIMGDDIGWFNVSAHGTMGLPDPKCGGGEFLLH